MCGSGLVDAVAELVHAGLLDHSGRFLAEEEAAESHPALRRALRDDRQGARVRAPPARRRIRPSPCSSPSATSASCSSRRHRSRPAGRSCCASSASSADEITQVLLAGSFGAYLTPLSAVRIGLVPKLALPRIVSAGNVAGEGAKIAALSARERAEAHAILQEVRLRRAVRARRLQRPVHRPARVPGMSAPVGGDRLRGARVRRAARSRAGAAGMSTSCRCPRCSTTARSASRRRWLAELSGL